MLKLLFWPLCLLWSFVGLIFKLTGRLLVGIVGLTLILAGAIITITVVGAVIGVPLIATGVSLLLCGL